MRVLFGLPINAKRKIFSKWCVWFINESVIIRLTTLFFTLTEQGSVLVKETATTEALIVRLKKKETKNYRLLEVVYNTVTHYLVDIVASGLPFS